MKLFCRTGGIFSSFCFLIQCKFQFRVLLRNVVIVYGLLVDEEDLNIKKVSLKQFQNAPKTVDQPYPNNPN